MMQILETGVIVAWSFIAMPKDPRGKPALMQVTLMRVTLAHLHHLLKSFPCSLSCLTW